MSTIRIVIVGLVLGVAPVATFAQAPPAPAASQQPAPAQPAQAQPAPPANADKAPPAVKKPDDQEFIPSEELSPDEEVTFPVDI